MPNGEAEKTWKVLDLLNWTARFFEKKGIDAPRLNAELLLAHVLGWPRVRLYTHFGEVPTRQQRAAYRALVQKRAGRCPVQYLLGSTEFLSRRFVVDPSVLVPRPETEQLVTAAIECLQADAASRTGPIVDLGTGSGVIAVSLALALPGATLVATDRSADALRVARENAQRHDVAGRIRFLEGDLFEPIRAAGLAGQVAAIVSNPPYVAEKDYDTLMPEVRDHEPAEALKAGPDGLDCCRRIAAEAAEILAPGGLLLLELGMGQVPAACKLLAAAGEFSVAEVRKDFRDIDRIVICTRR